MKKLFLLFTVLCAAVVTQAQVISAYTMQATQGTYTEITEGIVMDTIGMRVDEGLTEKAWYPTGVVSETTTAAGFPIGFDFEFNDIICNQFIIGSHSYIALGRDEITIDPTHGSYMPNQEENADNVIGLFINTMGGIWCLETTEISYQLVGEAPTRTLVVQFKDLGVNMGWGDAETVAKVNLQLRLNETSNTIEMVFGEFEYNEEETKFTRYALRGYYEDNLSLVEGEEPGMLNYVAVADDELAPFGSGTVAGTTFTFTPPAECVAPTQAVSNFVVNATSRTVTGSFEPVADADHYLILMSKNAEMATPVDGTMYHLGEYIGETLVYDYTTETTFDSDDWINSDWEELTLDPATEYHFAVYAANSFCARGPKYTVATTNSVSTKPAAPANVAITHTTLNSLTFDVEDNATDNVIVLLTDSVRLNPPYSNVIEFGTPEGELAVGDVLNDMGRVVYMGSSAQSIVVEGLEAGVAYYLRALSYDNAYNYSTDYVQCCDVTTATLPWSLDLTYTDLGGVPAGWESVGLNDGNNWTVANSSMGYGDEEQQLYMQTFPNVETGHIAELTTPRILIDKRDALFTFEYCMYIWARFGGNKPYDAWEANDKLAVLVSRNGGEFEEVHTITAENYVVPDSANQFIPVNVDLTQYINDEVRIRIHWECYSGTQIRMPIEGWSIDGRPILVVPEVTVSDITWNSANVSWRGEQESYEFAYAKVGEEFVANVVNEKSVILTDLTHLTDYQVKVRGIVAEGDTTDWCEVVNFTTTDLPECPIPEGLAHVETDDFGDKLSWTINEEHLSWDLRYRESSAAAWIEVEGLTTNEYVLYNLVPGSSYLWRLRAHCDMDRVSQYASQETFNANGKSAISAADADRLTVVAGNGVINIFNSDVYVESVALLDMQGRVIANYPINARENIVITTEADGVLLVVVNTVDKQLVYKVTK